MSSLGILPFYSNWMEKSSKYIRPMGNHVFQINNLLLEIKYFIILLVNHSFQDTLDALCTSGFDTETAIHFFFYFNQNSVER